MAEMLYLWHLNLYMIGLCEYPPLVLCRECICVFHVELDTINKVTHLCHVKYIHKWHIYICICILERPENGCYQASKTSNNNNRQDKQTNKKCCRSLTLNAKMASNECKFPSPAHRCIYYTKYQVLHYYIFALSICASYTHTLSTTRQRIIV